MTSLLGIEFVEVGTESPESDFESDSNEVEETTYDGSTSTISPNPLFPELTFKPRAKVVAYPEGKYTRKPESRMLQRSMKFIPLVNLEPKDTDAPYLFKVPGRGLGYAIARKNRASNQVKQEGTAVGCIPRPPSSPVTPINELLGLTCPTDPTSILNRAHQTFAMAFFNLYNQKVEGAMDFSEVIDPEKELSISCAMCCKLPRRPKVLEDEANRALDGGKYVPPPDYFGPVAFFPDFASLFPNPEDVPRDATPGWMDRDGVFHPAVMGDALPSYALIGYMDKAGVFHPLMSVKEGVKKGLIGLRMANTTEFKPYPGDPQTAFMEIAGYQDPEGTVYYHSPTDGQFGYVNDFDEFFELAPGETMADNGIRAFRYNDTDKILLMSRTLSQDKGRIPIGALSGYVDEHGNFFELPATASRIPPRGTRAYETINGDVVLISLAEDDDDWLNRLPPGAVAGYIDADGVFHELQPGEEIPRPGIRAYKTSDGQIVPVRISKSFPPGSVPGYVDKDGTFHELRNGEHLPEGAVLASKAEDQTVTQLGAVNGYIDKNGVFYELQEGVPIPDGVTAASRAGSRQPIPKFSDESLPEGAQHGYVDELGAFHELKKGDQLPEGGLLVIRTKDGKIVPAGANGMENLTLGYVDEEGVFHELVDAETLPAGAQLVYQDENGHLDQIDRQGSTLAEGDTVDGYVDETGEFHVLEEGQEIPPGSRRARRNALGEIEFFFPEEETEIDEESGTLQATPSKLAMFLGKGSAQGYIDENGVFRALAPGEASPNGIVGFVGSDGKFYVVPASTELGYIDENGQFVELQPGDNVPPNVQLGYRQDGDFHALPTSTSSGEEIRNDAKFDDRSRNPDETEQRRSRNSDPSRNPDATEQRRSRNPDATEERRSQNLDATEKRRSQNPDATDELRSRNPDATEELRPDNEGRVGSVTERGVSGYLDKDLTFHAVLPGEEIPEGAHLVYDSIDKSPSIPEGGRGAYRAFDGKVHELKEGETPPTGTMFGYVDEKGVFHSLRQQQEAGEDVDLRGGQEMTDEERERFEEFRRNLATQCELQLVEGSLDLGEVFRKTFRIYSHGGSVDIDLKPAPPQTNTT